MKILAPAKLNLFLHLTGRRDGGYHLLESIFVFTDFGDEINISSSNIRENQQHSHSHSDTCTNIRVTGSHIPQHPHSGVSPSWPAPARVVQVGNIRVTGSNIPQHPHSGVCGNIRVTGSNIPLEKNLVYRAAQSLHQTRQNITIHLEKRIPMSAGLGGGSADAAATLHALNQCWNLQLTPQQLRDIGLTLGADVPACIDSTPAFVSGIGEKITPMDGDFSMPVLLINPNKPLSTKKVFQTFHQMRLPFSASITPQFNLDWIAQQKNDLEKPAIALLPEIQVILNTLRTQTGCKLARMSGSGPTCFGLFHDILSINQAEIIFRQLFPHYWIVKSCIKKTLDNEC